MSTPTNRSLGPILVTGCSRGIGRVIAEHLATRGLGPVYATARDAEALARLEAAGCRPLPLDVTDHDARRNTIATIESESGPLYALVNNAGYGLQGPLEETPLDSIRDQFETNLFGVIGLCQEVLPGMRGARRGRIINLSSMGGRLTFPGGGAYHGSKYALEAISDVLRFEVAGFGIKVVVIEPGPTASDFGLTSLASLAALTQNAKTGDAYRALRDGIRAALEGTFAAPPPGATSSESVALAVERALTEEQPEPRVIVGEMAEQLIHRKEHGSAQDWDAVVAQMYPQPGTDPGETDPS